MIVFLVSGRWADNCRNEKKNSVELPRKWLIPIIIVQKQKSGQN